MQPKYKSMILSGLLLAIGLVLPFLTAQIKEIGDSLLPMHFPVLLCGFLAGPWYGLGIGLLLPFLRSFLFGMPPVYPNAVWMACELATYGLVAGLLYRNSFEKKLWYLYFSLLTAMISGRIVWGVVKSVLLGLSGKAFTMEAFLVGGFIDAIPGIVLQLIFIPAIIKLTEKK